jgi:hypothetical protein
MFPFHWSAIVYGWLHSNAYGFMSRSAPLWGQIFGTVQFRLLCFDIYSQRYAVARTGSRIGLFRLQNMICHESKISPVLVLDMTNFPFCGHWMNLGSPRKRSLQFGLHTQQLVVLGNDSSVKLRLHVHRSTVFGQSTRAPSFRFHASVPVAGLN